MTKAHRPFRFGVVGTPHGGAAAWRGLVARVADRGYTSLLMPDGMQLPAPFPSLAMAAALAPLRVGTFVLAAPLRPPGSAAWEAHTMSVLTEGRFELGVGTGRPVVQQWAEELGLPWGSAAERLAQVDATIDRLRALDGTDRHTPVLMAVGGPKARALAAAKADIVTIAAGALVPRAEIGAQLADVRARAGDRVGAVELAMNVFVVGDEVPPHVQQYVGAGAAELSAMDSLAMLRGSTDEMADELQRRRDQFGLSYFAVNAEFMDNLAPVVERLTGQ
jgi:alkanesulfonate monooxygenase SsuD/methylene tetrahydromethanopterin reductase-like flavin-dependent oxidoreductase (luciferase family)